MPSVQGDRSKKGKADGSNRNDPARGFTVTIPYPAKPKARPRVTTAYDGTSHTYMPATYTEWKENVANVIRLYGKNLSGKVITSMVFHPTHFTLRVQETEKQRFGRADLDNLVGGVMDAMQDSGVIRDDHDVVWIEAVFAQDEE